MNWLWAEGYWTVDNFITVASLFFAGVLAMVAIISARLSSRLLHETTQLREAETHPLVAVYLESQKIEPFFFDMVIRNVARSSAYDVSFNSEDIEVESSESAVESGGLQYPQQDHALFRDGITYMAPGQEIRFFFGSYIELPKVPMKVVVTFFAKPKRDRDRMTFQETYIVDVRQFEGVGYVGEAPEKAIARSLDKIARDVEHIRRGDRGSNVTVNVRRRYALSKTINARWFLLSRRWRNFRIRWDNGEISWKGRWKRRR